MKAIKTGNQFLRDLKRARKRGKDLRKAESIINTIALGGPLPAKHRPHRLKGEMKGLWECHIEPDWLLIWDDTDDAIILIRNGTHADLFE